MRVIPSSTLLEHSIEPSSAMANRTRLYATLGMWKKYSCFAPEILHAQIAQKRYLDLKIESFLVGRHQIFALPLHNAYCLSSSSFRHIVILFTVLVQFAQKNVEI
ncbi:hypothetical protein AVEN_45183-1 [Araneus ventricosus]|uniref:Uncharacterized protein n=1 Tax=Araneus ventricosus TaxID=182803 RepID=A0A4Y1ZSL3_ARAVE|nr:hypothetical protein AVEN_45183-1 [Araneus ventricosus]